jgi:Protein of unknown function (DUF2971)
MRVYHFINEEYGLKDLHRRRLKVSRIEDLNDPFELLAADLSDRDLRRAFQATRRQLAQRSGMLCFSANWSNPVMWSHYADKHRGLCLGFEVPNEVCMSVVYTKARLPQIAEEILQLNPGHPDAEAKMRRLLTTKYIDWSYENEIRIFTSLDSIDPDSNLHFVDFSERLKLTKVVVGARSHISRNTVREALRDLDESVDVIKARLAFKRFQVVPNKVPSLWK